MKTVLRNARILTADGFRDDLAVVIEAGRITALVSDAAPQLGSAAEQVDLGGGWLLPGFIDAQVNGGGGMQFAFANEGTIMKDIDQSWLGNVIATGTPTYYRLCPMSDGNTASTTAVRVQGSVGATGDLKLGTTTLATGNPQSIDFYQLRLPQYLGG